MGIDLSSHKQPSLSLMFCSHHDDFFNNLWKNKYSKLSVCVCVCVCAQSSPTICDPMNYSPPGSSVHGIFQARTLQQVAISHSRGSSWPRDQTHVSCIFCIGRQIITEPPRKLILYLEHVSFQTSHSSSAQQLYVASGLHTEQQRLELRGEHYS